MQIVILLGYSTSGKSHYCNLIKDKLGETIATFDTDEFVSYEYSNHIYNLFLENTKEDDNRTDALRLIEEKEIEAIEYLKSFNSNNILVAAGPCIVSRANWSEYVNLVPNIHFIYLYKTPEDVYNGLMERRKKHEEKGISRHPNFGCRDKGTLTFFNGKTYELNSKEEAINNIKKEMNGVTSIYEKLSNGHLYNSEELKQDDKKQETLVDTIISYFQKD